MYILSFDFKYGKSKNKIIVPKLYPWITFRQNFFGKVPFFCLLFSDKQQSLVAFIDVTWMENNTKIDPIALKNK